MPLADMFWGDRYGRLVDPFGHHWSIAEHLVDLTPEQMKERLVAAMSRQAQEHHRRRAEIVSDKETAATNVVDSLLLDLLDWIGPNPRPYSEVIEAWRTSCPACRYGRRPTSEVFSNEAASRVEERCGRFGAGREFLARHRH